MIFKKIQIHQVLISLIIGAVIGAWGIQMRDYGCLMSTPKPGSGMRQHMIKKMEHELKLDGEQKEKLTAIFKAKQPRMKALRAEMRPKFEALRDETRDEIRGILKPEQLPRFEKLNREMDERWEKFRSKREKN